jgi:3-phosphoshikimate 1-carboxyvinyltransferase
MNLENSLYKVEPTPFHKKIELPTSKSHANRALIIGAVRGGGFRINHLATSTDVVTMLACLEKIGLKIERKDHAVIFHNAFPACENETATDIIDLQTGDGGTTNRFLLALLARGKKTYRLNPTEKMSERPMDDLLNPLKLLNVHLETNVPGAWIVVRGPANMLNTSKLEIDCSKSTQFASAMMLAFSNLPLQIECKNIKASETYIAMTKSLLKETLLKNSYTIPVDFSSLSYPLALALLRGNVLIKNALATDPLQTDALFVELMQKAGGDIEWTAQGLRASSKNTLKPFEVDGSMFPDLIPTLAFMAAHIEGESVLTNLSILRHKESDRLEEILKLLKNLSIDFQFIASRDEIRIQGSVKPYKKVLLTPARDHRMVMVSYLFLRANSGGEVTEADCVEKSFSNFFGIMN